MNEERSYRHEDIELIRAFSGSLSGSEEASVSDEALLRLIFFSDRDELEQFARQAVDSHALSRRFFSLRAQCDRYSVEPISDSPSSSDDEVAGYISGAIEESFLTSSAAKEMSDVQWNSPESSQREMEALWSSAIRLCAHSMRASMSDIYVSSFRGAAVAEARGAGTSQESDRYSIEVHDPFAEILANGTLRYTARIDSAYEIESGKRLGLHLIDPCGGSLLLGETSYAEKWSIEIPGFEDLARLRTQIVPPKLFAVCLEGQTPKEEQWRSYVYDLTSPQLERTPSSELLIWSPPRVEDGILTFGVDFPDGMLEVHDEDRLRLNIRIGWRKQALAEWPMSAFLSDRYTFRVPFPYVENQSVPFGSMFFFEIC